MSGKEQDILDDDPCISTAAAAQTQTGSTSKQAYENVPPQQGPISSAQDGQVYTPY